MCNCNQKRASYSSGVGNQNDAPLGMIQVKLVQGGLFTITGDITGRVYVFKKMNDITWVDKRDLMYMEQVKELQILQ
jgi:hypothetical protein